MEVINKKMEENKMEKLILEDLKVSDRIIYRPVDEDTWYTGTVERDSYGRLYVHGDDGIDDYPRHTDEIKLL